MDAALLEVVVAVVEAGQRLHKVRRLVVSYDNVRLEQAVEAGRAVEGPAFAVGPPASVQRLREAPSSTRTSKDLVPRSRATREVTFRLLDWFHLRERGGS